MFVIMQSLSNVKRSHDTSSLPPDQQIAEALKHAGVAVTVTSVTDVFAFACGAVTVSFFMIMLCIVICRYIVSIDHDYLTEYARTSVFLCSCGHWTRQYLHPSGNIDKLESKVKIQSSIPKSWLLFWSLI